MEFFACMLYKKRTKQGFNSCFAALGRSFEFDNVFVHAIIKEKGKNEKEQ